MEIAYGPATDPSLLKRLKDTKNDSAWSLFKQRYEPVIARRCRGWRLQSADVDEVTSIALARLVQSLGSFKYDPGKRFRGWLRTLVDNVVKDFWENQRRRPGTTGSGDTDVHKKLEQIEESGETTNAGGRVDEAEWAQLERAWAVVERVRGRIEARSWRAYWLSAMEGRPAREVAAELGMSTAAVYQNKKRVGDKLRQEALALRSLDADSTEIPP